MGDKKQPQVTSDSTLYLQDLLPNFSRSLPWGCELDSGSPCGLPHVSQLSRVSSKNLLGPFLPEDLRLRQI